MSGVAHLVGSVPLPDSESVFRTLSAGLGSKVKRLPDGETGIRKSWIKFLQDVLADNPAIEVAAGVPPFKFVQWDGKVIREIPRLRIRKGMTPNAGSFITGYADMGIASYNVFEKLQKDGAIPPAVKFQVCLPTPTAPTYNNMVPGDRAALLEPLTRHFIGEVKKLGDAIPNDKLAIQWDVCQEVLAWEGYYDQGPVDFRVETLNVLGEVGNAVPRGIELGYHLCYGSPADEHMVQPKDARLMVEMVNAIVPRVGRPIEFFHLPVPKGRTDDAFFAPLRNLSLRAGTELYLGLIHHNDRPGDDARLAAAKKYTRVDGIGTECGWARGDPTRIDSLIRSHARVAELT